MANLARHKTKRDIALSLFDEDLDHFDEDMTMFVGEATKLSTRLGGLGLREQHLTLISAFISSITSCFMIYQEHFLVTFKQVDQRESSLFMDSQKSTDN